MPKNYEPHSHKCTKCGVIWFHNPPSLKTTTEHSHEEAHKCPACYKLEWKIYQGAEQGIENAHCVNTGREITWRKLTPTLSFGTI